MNKFGIITTIIYTGVVIYIRWDSLPTLKTIPLNEFGDFFAGVFGPIALFWLILGYLQQGKELRQSSEALKLQAEELNNSVKQQEELVNVTNKQIENSQEEEKINRTLREIENWLHVKRNVERNKYDRKNIYFLCDNIEWIISIEEHQFRCFFKVDLLMHVIREKSIKILVSDIYSDLSDEFDSMIDDPALDAEQTKIDEVESMGCQISYSEKMMHKIEIEKLLDRIIKIRDFINNDTIS